MQAVRIHRFGGPEVMTIQEIDQPKPTANEVLIKVFAASVNPVDAKMREGKYPVVTEKDLPYVLGAGRQIEAKGDDVSSFQVGDEVFAFLSPEHGGYEEFVLARADEVSTKPRTLDAIAAAAVPLAGITAWQGLFDQGGLQPGQRVLIHGGAGGVGHFAIHFAKAKGAWVATTVSSTNKEFVRDLGANEVIDYKAEKFEDRVDPVDLVFDLIGGETQGAQLRRRQAWWSADFDASRTRQTQGQKAEYPRRSLYGPAERGPTAGNRCVDRPRQGEGRCRRHFRTSPSGGGAIRA